MGRKPAYSLTLTLDDPPVAEHAPPPTAEEFIAGERFVSEPDGVPIHEAARLMPMMTEREFTELRQSIRLRGFDPKKPLVFFGDELLDGRNRLAAALAEGVLLEHLPREFYTGESPFQYVWDENYGRRHLTKDQRLAIAAKAEPLLAAEAKRRMVEGGRLGGKGGNGSSPRSRNERGRTAVLVAERAAAGIGSAQAMITLQKKAPEVAALMVDRGVKLPEAKRLAAVEDPAERAEKVAQIRSGADPAKVAPRPPRAEPNLGRMLSLLFVRSGQGPKLGAWRDLLAKVVGALGSKESHVQHSGKRITLRAAVEILAEKLPRPGGS